MKPEDVSKKVDRIIELLGDGHPKETLEKRALVGELIIDVLNNVNRLATALEKLANKRLKGETYVVPRN